MFCDCLLSVALDAGPYGVTPNAVLPGSVQTEMAERSAKVAYGAVKIRLQHVTAPSAF